MGPSDPNSMGLSDRLAKTHEQPKGSLEDNGSSSVSVSQLFFVAFCYIATFFSIPFVHLLYFGALSAS